MSLLYEYISNIAVFLVFVTFAEILLPSSKYKSYVNLVIGFLLIMVLLKPIGILFGESKQNIESNILSMDNKLNKGVIQKEEQFYSKKQKDMIIKQFRENLESQVSQILLPYGETKRVNITLKEAESIEIDKIEIVFLPKEEKKSFFRIEEKSKDKYNEILENIKIVISDFYNLSTDNINITIQKN